VQWNIEENIKEIILARIYTIFLLEYSLELKVEIYYLRDYRLIFVLHIITGR